MDPDIIFLGAIALVVIVVNVFTSFPISLKNKKESLNEYDDKQMKKYYDEYRHHKETMHRLLTFKEFSDYVNAIEFLRTKFMSHLFISANERPLDRKFYYVKVSPILFQMVSSSGSQFLHIDRFWRGYLCERIDSPYVNMELIRKIVDKSVADDVYCYSPKLAIILKDCIDKKAKALK